MTKTFELIATVGTWVDPGNGKTVKRTCPIGAVFMSPHGNLVMKLDAVPVSRDWSGWVAMKTCGPALPLDRRVSPGMPPVPSNDPSPPSEKS